jgi:hypothetical protein
MKLGWITCSAHRWREPPHPGSVRQRRGELLEAEGADLDRGQIDLGEDYYDRRHAERAKRRALQTLERQGYRVTIEPGA